MGVALGLGAAFSWGASDYFVALAARRLGALRVALGFHLVALIPLGILALATGSFARVGGRDVAIFALLGAVGWLAYLAFYRALAIGPISVISPLASGYAAVAVILSVLVAGATLSALEALAVGITIAGVAAAAPEAATFSLRALRGHPARGPLLAIAAMLLFGTYVFGLSYHHRSLGWVAPVVLARGFTALFLLAHAAAGRRVQWRGLALSDLGPIALIATLDTLGYLFYRLGVVHAPTPLVATASAPYGLIASILGVRLLRERPTARQWLALLTVVAGLALLGAES